VQLVNKDHKFAFATEDVYKVNLLDNYKVEAVFCKGGSNCESKTINGHWTSIYDQALNVELDNGTRFLANLRYNIKPEVSADPFKQALASGLHNFGTIESGDYDKFNS